MATESIIHNSRFLNDVIWRQHSNKLIIQIMELWPDKNIPVVDIGCGYNFYCSVLEFAGFGAIGIDDCLFKGIDLWENITRKSNPPSYPNLIDLILYNHKKNPSFSLFTKKYLQCKKANVISLDVGLRIPQEKYCVYLDNICGFNGDIIMSWNGVVGDAGSGHIQFQSNNWVISEMFKRGYSIDMAKTKELRFAVNGCHCNWFQETLMYFIPKNKL